jgi:NDP-4-keto-2,6-dideoxyhexose 3-C-methyltransferase
VTAQKLSGRLKPTPSVETVLQQELTQRLGRIETYVAFAENVRKSRDALRAFLETAKRSGKRVVGLGASTKGNVILQYCGIDSSLLECIGEINPDKFGAFTPGTHVPIIEEGQAIGRNPDYALVFPWHFRRHFESQPRYSSLKLVYPLPVLSGANDAGCGSCIFLSPAKSGCSIYTCWRATFVPLPPARRSAIDSR